MDEIYEKIINLYLMKNFLNNEENLCQSDDTVPYDAIPARIINSSPVYSTISLDFRMPTFQFGKNI